MSLQSRYPTPLVDQRKFFDELITEEWASYSNEAWDFSRTYEVYRILRACQPARVLDIGCGCGFHDLQFASRDFVTRVDAIDYSEKSIEKAEQAYPHPKVLRRVADLATDAIEPAYDLVVSFQVFEHLPDPDVYLRYCLRARRPGGAIAIVTPNRRRVDNRIREWRGEPPAMVDPQHFHEYTIRELAALGERHGLQLTHSFGHTLQSLIYQRLTPKNYRTRVRMGSLVPHLASIIGVILR